MIVEADAAVRREVYTEEQRAEIAQALLENGLEDLIRFHWQRIVPHLDPDDIQLVPADEFPQSPMNAWLKVRMLAAETQLAPYLKEIDGVVYFAQEHAMLMVGLTDFYVGDR